MSWLESIHVIASAAIFIAACWVNDDEPFINRAVLALAYAVLWLPALILLVLMLLVDGVVALFRKVRGK